MDAGLAGADLLAVAFTYALDLRETAAAVLAVASFFTSLFFLIGCIAKGVEAGIRSARDR